MVQISLHQIRDLNKIGEILRELCFVPDSCGGDFGCYSTFALREDFTPVANDSDLGRELIGLMLGDPDRRDEIYDELMAGAVCHSNGEIDICWHWDGDGTLLFRFDGIAIVNSDCKKSYGWEPAILPDSLSSLRDDKVRPEDIDPASPGAAIDALAHACALMQGAKKFYSISTYGITFREELVSLVARHVHQPETLSDMAERIIACLTPVIDQYQKAKDRPNLQKAVRFAQIVLRQQAAKDDHAEKSAA